VVAGLKMSPKDVNKMDLDDIFKLGMMVMAKEDHSSALSGFMKKEMTPKDK